MQQNNLHNVPVASRLQNMNRKTFVACVLVGIMVLLWIRVLLRGQGSPAAAEAQEQQQIENDVSQSKQTVEIVPVKLDVIEGRHDVLGADIFSDDNWDAFDLDNKGENARTSQHSIEQEHQIKLKKIAAALKLEAIIQNSDGEPYQVFVNEKILTVGSVLTVKEGSEKYELVLKKIGENEAVFNVNETSIVLKMPETAEK